MASNCSTAAPVSASHARPSSARPSASRLRAILRRSISATRAEALPQVAANNSWGNTNIVRRIASCRTSVRCSYSAVSTSATLTSGARAATDRYTEGASVACNATTAVVTSSGVLRR